VFSSPEFGHQNGDPEESYSSSIIFVIDPNAWFPEPKIESKEIYSRDVDLPVSSITAQDRFSNRV